MVAENDQVTRALKLGVTVGGLVMGGKRDPQKVASILQIINNEVNFAEVLAVGVSVADVSKIREELILWQQFDQKFFPDVNVGSYTSLRIPAPIPGFDWPIVNACGITANMLIARMKKEFSVYTYTDDLGSVRSDREPVSLSYVVLVRDRVEADEELKGKSANVIAEEAIPSIVLPERLRLEFFHWWKTGKHLDVQNVTLCTGSRYRDGRVPYVYGGGGRLSVGWDDPSCSRDDLRARAVVS